MSAQHSFEKNETATMFFPKKLLSFKILQTINDNISSGNFKGR